MCTTIRIMRGACTYLFWQLKLYQITLVTIRPFTHPPLLPAIIITKYFELLANTSLICMHMVTPGLEHNAQMGHTRIEHANLLQLWCVATYVVTYLSVAVCLSYCLPTSVSDTGLKHYDMMHLSHYQTSSEVYFVPSDIKPCCY